LSSGRKKAVAVLDQTMLAEVLAVIGGDDDDRVVGALPAPAERTASSRSGIHVRDAAVVRVVGLLQELAGRGPGPNTRSIWSQ
jgi:hypothetical protein